jgi:UDP-N-acetylglucosamine 2-epimerase
MPEEQNRVITDHLSDVLLCPTQQAIDNLAREGVTKGVHLVGDVMYDACRAFAALAATQPGAVGRGLEPGGYVLVTIHRAAATDTPEALSAMVEVLTSLGAPAIFPVHPLTRAKLEAAGRWDELQNVPGLIMARPAGYLDFTALLMQAQAVITDSGGVQKEAYFHGIPCITLRDTTEWVETVDGGFNRLTGMDAAKVAEAMADLSMPDERPQYYGDGHAADAIVRALVTELG